MKDEEIKILFTQTRYERALERDMTLVPNFKPRGNVVIVISQFKYTAEMCSCEYCTEYKAKKCKAKKCICFEERLEAGAVSYALLIKETFADTRHPYFKLRLNNIIRESEKQNMFYRGKDHQRNFENALFGLPNESPAIQSAIYLLTSDNKLWSNAKKHVNKSSIDFCNIKLTGTDVDAYTLLKTAQDLYSGTKHITIYDLSNPVKFPTCKNKPICKISTKSKISLLAP
jgi:hypothetical protein